MVDLPPGFRVVANGEGQQIGGFAPKTATQPTRMVIDGTPSPLPPGFRIVSQPVAAPAQAPAPAPMTPQQAQGMDLPVPDGQGGIDPSFSPTDRGQPMQPAKRAPEDGAGRALDIALQGDRQGVGELLGFPVDMASAGLNLGAMALDQVIPGDQHWLQNSNPIGGSSNINSLIEGAVPGEPFSYDEMTTAQRLGFEGNRFGVQSMLPSAFLSNPVVRQALGKLAPAIAPKVEELSRPYTTGANMVNDTVAGVGAGVGYGAYDEYTPEPVKDALGPLGDVISSMGGGIGANLAQNVVQAVARNAWGGARRLAGFGRPQDGVKSDMSMPQNPDGSFVNNKDADVAALYVQNMASNPKAAAQTVASRANDMAATGAPKAAIPSSGILSDDPGLVAFEKGYRLDPEMHKDFIANQQATETAAVNSAKEIAPETAIGRQFTNAVQQDDAARVGQASARVDAAQQDLAGADQRSMQLGAELAAKRGGEVSASRKLDPVITDRLMTDQKVKNDAFAAIDPTGEVQRPIDPLLDRVKSIESNTSPLDDPSSLPSGLMGRVKTIAEDTGSISFKDLNAARPRLASQIAVARKAQDYQLADNLASIKSTIDQEAERMATEGGEAGIRAQQAMQEYGKFAAVWNKGPGDEAALFRKDFNLDRAQRTTTPPSQTAGRFLQQGQPEKAASLKRILDNNPAGAQGHAAVSDFLSADLAAAPGVVKPNGALDRAAIERWAAKWGDDALDISADFRAQLNGLIIRAGENSADNSTLATQLKEAKAALDDAVQNKGAIARVLGKDPVNAVASILSSGDAQTNMKEIVDRIAGNDSALNGLKASVREYLMERGTTSAIQKTTTGENPLSFARLDELFKAHEDALSEVFSPDEMNSLRAAHQFLAPLKNLEMKTVVGSQTSANDRMWADIKKPLEVAFNLRYGVLKGGGVMKILNTWRQMLPNGDAAALELIDRMWFDPELAKHLLTREVKEVDSARYNAKLIWLLSRGAGARAVNEPDEPVDNSVDN